MNKILLLIWLSITVISCDNKKAKLDELYGKQASLKKQVDSLSLVRSKILDNATGDAASVGPQLEESATISAKIDVLNRQLTKVAFSIDSLSKY